MSKLWPNYKNWSEQENQNKVYRYTSKVYRYTLAKNDQNRKCTGTLSKCTGTSHPKCPKMCVFPHFSIFLIPKSILYFKHTSKSFHMSLVISFLLNSSFNTYLMHSIELKHGLYSSLIQSLGFYSTQLQEI